MRFLSGAFTLTILAGALTYVAFSHPKSPIPPEMNPASPLDVSAPVNRLTPYKLRRSAEGQACLAALRTSGAEFDVLPDFEESEQCHIRDRVRLRSLGTASIRPLQTRCTTALRLAIWTRHGLEPAAEEIFGQGVARVHHQDSYNCRRIRTPSGQGSRMSTHSTADAVDITGVTLDDGRQIHLIEDWGQGDKGAFLAKARDTSCDWFVTTLGPEFNSLHADHFHLQSRGWGTCR